MSTFYAKAGDTVADMTATLTDTGGTVIDLNGASVAVRGFSPYDSNRRIDGPCTIVDAAAGVVRFDLTNAHTSTPADFLFEWVVIYADEEVQTFPNAGYDRLLVGENRTGS